MLDVLLQSRRVLAHALALLVLAAALASLLLRGSHPFPPVPAALLAASLALFGLALVLPIGYVCRTVPAGPPFLQTLALHALGTILSGLAWGFLGTVLTRQLGPSFPTADLPARYLNHAPALTAAGGAFYLLVASMQYTLLALAAARRSERDSLELRVLARDAEIKALKAQVHPHFLFNSLNSISALIGSDPPRAREMCVLLSEFFRQSLTLGEQPAVSLEDELKVARTYLAIESLRLGPRLVVEESMPVAALACRLPPLLLQPLVENAIRHGIATCEKGGVLRLEARMDGQSLHLSVLNPFDPGAPARPGVGLGLTNVKERLRTRYGGRAWFQAERGEGRFSVSLLLPIREDV